MCSGEALSSACVRHMHAAPDDLPAVMTAYVEVK